jgi:leader peptidase (prepilin peptidase)/N-methyltransferase
LSDLAWCIFLFVFGASVGSFLNVVVWRLPRFGWRSLISPPSHCPKCEHRLAWRDNIPVFGWIFLGGKCRYCRAPISPRYPIIEFITGGLFVGYYLMFFVAHYSPCAPAPAADVNRIGQIVYVPRMMGGIAADWPMYALFMFLIGSLLAVSLIDAELFEIPLEITWMMAGVGIAAHALVDGPHVPGALNLMEPTGIAAGLAVGGAVGLAAGIFLLQTGRVPVAFPEGEPGLEVDEAAYQEAVAEAKREGEEPPRRPPVYTRRQIRAEIRKEMLFLLPPLVGAAGMAVLAWRVPVVHWLWVALSHYYWITGMLGSVLGALVGGLVVWLARILGTLAFGRVAMGLGDAHLMFGVGAIIGAGPAVVAFFVAPFMAILVGLYMLVTRKRHELPYGPYLSLATGVVLLFYCRPGLEGVFRVVQEIMETLRSA